MVKLMTRYSATLLLIHIFWAPLLAAQDTQEVFPIVASFVSEKDKSKVFKNPEILIVKGAKAYSRGIYFKFEKVKFNNKQVKKAELILECVEMGKEASGSINLVVGQVDNAWDPDKMTWENSPVPSGSVGNAVVKTKGPVIIPITNFIKKIAKEGTPAFALVIADLQKSKRLVKFAGLPDDKKKPRIKVYY